MKKTTCALVVAIIGLLIVAASADSGRQFNAVDLELIQTRSGTIYAYTLYDDGDIQFHKFIPGRIDEPGQTE